MKVARDSMEILDLTLKILDDMKALDIKSINVSKQSSITDYMIFTTGTSSRHSRSVIDKVSEKAKQEGYTILGIEGYESGQWILIDLETIILHIMLDEVRLFYKLDDLWSVGN